eukprot:gb/GECG01002203.1/.p1 GENE.gb/GECG01002203.1/~~gb/GECG01002203.1/.p1  ORF type:complete len:554 (+),score=92.24 gb/GECG01002203.1/:1-1662(+)
MSMFGAGGRGPPAYILSLDIQNVGRTIARSKKRITWKFVFEEDPDEHMVALLHSVTSGKKVIVLDGQTHYTDEEISMGEWIYTFQFQNHSMSVYIGSNPASEDYYDLRIDNMTSRMLPRTTMLDHRERSKKHSNEPPKQKLDDFASPKERSGSGGSGKKSSGRKARSSNTGIRRPSTNTKPNQQAATAADTFDWQVAGAGGSNFDPFAEGDDSESESSGHEFDPFYSGNAAAPANGQHTQQRHQDKKPQSFDPFGDQSSGSHQPAQPTFDPFGGAPSSQQRAPAPQQSDFDPFNQPTKSKPAANPGTDFDPFSQPSQNQRETNAMQDIYHKAANNTTTSPEDDLSQLRFDTEGPRIGDSNGGTQPPGGLGMQEETHEDMIARLENNPMDDSWNISGQPTAKTGKVPLNAMKNTKQNKKQVMEPPSEAGGLAGEAHVPTGMGWGGMYQPPRGQYPPGQMPPQGYPYQGYPPQGFPPQGGMPPQGYGAPNMMGGAPGAMQQGPQGMYPQQPVFNQSTGMGGGGMGGGAPAAPRQQPKDSNNSNQKNLDFDPFADF